MGRIKTMLIKRTTEELFEKHPTACSADFEQNKKNVVTLLKGEPSKKLRNVIAGYATRLYKKREAQAL